MNKILSIAAALLVVIPSLPAQAGYSHAGGVKERTCYKEVYRETYQPGTSQRRGYVRAWTESKKVPCNGGNSRRNTNRVRGRDRNRPNPARRNVDDNSCIEGALLGGIGGGALGGTLATQENWIWSVPLGIIGGTLVGCEIDGG